jgi:hypothetical protein
MKHKSSWTPVVKVNNNETAVPLGEFGRMRQKNIFAKEYVDEEDSIKLIGITADNKIYVSEKIMDDMTDTEFDEYMHRQGVYDSDFFQELTEEEIEEERKNALLIM